MSERGFLHWRREPEPRRPTDERTRDHREIGVEPTPQYLHQQAGRCMDCGVPFCHQGCPLGNPIPDFNQQAGRDRWHDAYRLLAATNNFPEFTGRLCPAPCETACVLAINDDAVAIEAMEKAIAERAFSEGWITARPPETRSTKRVAVVGSGPAGLACAAQLNNAGHTVTVFEAADRIGGLLRYGIPDFKMERLVLDRRLALLTAEGVNFVTNAEVGRDPTWDALRRKYHALVIAVGAERPRDLSLPGRDLRGVHFAMDYLTRQNRLNAGQPDRLPELDAKGKVVVVLGGGDTGSDCLGTALRQRAAVVHQIELLPEPPRQRIEARQPWPQWPMILRTSSSQEEGGERDFAVLTESLSGQNGQLAALHGVRIDPKAAARQEIRRIPGKEFNLDLQLLILAMGFVGPRTDALVEQLGVELTDRGNVRCDRHFQTSVEGVFCAGDAHRGQSLIVWAISEGREAARAVDSYLRGKPSALPTRGIDSNFETRVE